MRDLFASSVSYVNAVGGTNGKGIAVLKSDLNILELLTGNAEDDRAQASESWAA